MFWVVILFTVTFSTTTISGPAFITGLCNPECLVPALPCNADRTAVAVPLGMAGICTTTTGGCGIGAASQPTVSTIDLSGTSFELTAGMNINSQFVYLGNLSMLIQPPPGTQRLSSTLFGIDANSSKTVGTGITSTVTFGIREAKFTIGRVISYTNIREIVEHAAEPADDNCIEYRYVDEEQRFCDFTMSYDWVSDIANNSLSMLLPYFSRPYCDPMHDPAEWPARFIPSSQTDYIARLGQITKGGKAICVCPAGNTGLCDTSVCGWGGASEFQQWYYTESTASLCPDGWRTATQYTSTSDRVCTINQAVPSTPPSPVPPPTGGASPPQNPVPPSPTSAKPSAATPDAKDSSDTGAIIGGVAGGVVVLGVVAFTVWRSKAAGTRALVPLKQNIF
jgi:hypothetical protein